MLHPDDLLFRRFRERIERKQGTLARYRKPRRQGELPIDDGRERAEPIVPLASNATALRWARLAPGPDFAAARSEQVLNRQPDLLEVPSRRERAADAGRPHGRGPGGRG